MALSPEKLRAYRPLLAVLVAELVAEYEAEQQGDQVNADGGNEALPAEAPADPEGNP